MEIWKSVVGWEDGYEVSSLGRVRSIDRVIRSRNGAKTYSRKGKVLSQSTASKYGHVTVFLRRPGEGKRISVHKLVAEAFIGPRPDGEQTRHKNGDPTDNRAVNLCYGTRSVNTLDSVLHGTHNQSRKLTCKWGHVLKVPNLVASSLRTGRRSCLACGRTNSQIGKAKMAGRPVPEFKILADQKYAEIMGAEDAAA